MSIRDARRRERRTCTCTGAAKGVGGEAVEAPRRPVILSGIQPSGKLMIGNYLGAMLNWVKLQESHECFYMLVDLHAITVPQKPADLRRQMDNNIRFRVPINFFDCFHLHQIIIFTARYKNITAA